MREPFHFIPLLDVPSSSIDPKTPLHPTSHSTSTPTLATATPPQDRTTCHRCGLRQRSSSHGVKLDSPLHSRHNSSSHCLPISVPEIETAEHSCPDINSPASPRHDAETDPFDVYQAHERQYERQGHSRLSISEQTDPELELQQKWQLDSETIVENPSDGIATAMAVALALEGATKTDSDGNYKCKRTERRGRHHRLGKERHNKTSELLYGEDNRVEEAVRRELARMRIAGEKQTGIVEVGCIAERDF